MGKFTFADEAEQGAASPAWSMGCVGNKRLVLAQFAPDITATRWLTRTRSKLLIISFWLLSPGWSELIQGGLHQRRRTSEGCFSESVDRGRQIHKAPGRGFTEHAEETSDAESAFRSETASGLFVKKNEVGLDRLSQDDRCALACLKLFQVGEDNVGGRCRGDPRRRV